MISSCLLTTHFDKSGLLCKIPKLVNYFEMFTFHKKLSTFANLEVTLVFTKSDVKKVSVHYLDYCVKLSAAKDPNSPNNQLQDEAFSHFHQDENDDHKTYHQVVKSNQCQRQQNVSYHKNKNVC